MSDQTDITDLSERLQILRRRLSLLEKQRAKFGLYTPSHIEYEIDEISSEIEQLEAELRSRNVSSRAQTATPVGEPTESGRSEATPALAPTTDPLAKPQPALSSAATRAGDGASADATPEPRTELLPEAPSGRSKTTDDSDGSQKKQPSARGAKAGLLEKIGAVVFMIGVLGIVGWYYWTEQQRADTAFDQGLVHLQAGAYDLASDDFTRAVNLDEKRVDAYYHRGLAYKGRAEQFSALGLNREAEEKFTAAIQDFSKAIDRGQVASEVFYNRGLAYAGQKQFAAAVDDLNRAIGRGLSTAEVYYNRGLALAGKGDRSAAIDDFNRAIGRGLSTAEVYYNRALSYISVGQQNAARTDLEQALALTDDPNLRRQVEEQLKAIGSQ